MTGIFGSIRNSSKFGGSPKRDSSSGSRGGGSKLYKQDVDGKIDVKKLCDRQTNKRGQKRLPSPLSDKPT